MAHRAGRPDAFNNDAGVIPQFRHACLRAMREDLGAKDALNPTVSQGPYVLGVANLYDYSPIRFDEPGDDHPSCSS